MEGVEQRGSENERCQTEKIDAERCHRAKIRIERRFARCFESRFEALDESESHAHCGTSFCGADICAVQAIHLGSIFGKTSI